MSTAGFWSDVRWQALGNASAQVIGVLGMPLLTRLYQPQDFAALSVFAQFAMFFAGVMTLRYEYFVQLPREDREAGHLIRLVALLCIAGTLLLTPLVWLAAQGAAASLAQPELLRWLWLSPLTAALISLSLAYQHRAQRYGLFKLSGAGEVAAKSSYVAGGALAAMAGLGTLGLVLTTAWGCLAKLLLHLGAGFGRAAPARAGGGVAALRAVATRYRGPAASMLVAHLMGTITGLAPILFVGAAYGSELLGQFSLVTMTIFLPASLIGSAIGSVFYQRAAHSWSHGEPFAELWRQTLLKLALIGVPVYGLVALLSPWLYPALFGANWEAAGRFAPWMSLAALCAFVSTPLERACLITGQLRYQALWHAARAVTTVLVVAAALALDWRFETFLAALVLQMSALYVFDAVMEGRFARLRPPAGQRPA